MDKKKSKNLPKLLEASRAIALTVNNINPAVVSAYPITPQTHIVEDLASFKANGQASYEYVRAESEFAAASIVLGASATGLRTYSATSSQGLLLMTEVIYNIAGLRLPIVMTCANRAVSGPINIWNDQQDVMTIRDSGWILLFAQDHQEAVNQHILAYKLAEKLKIPVMINVDGYVLTHAYESVIIPENKQIKKFLPDYQPTKGDYLNSKQPMTIGAFATPADYFEIRQELHDDLLSSLPLIDKEYKNWQKIFGKTKTKTPKNIITIDNGWLEYYGPKKPKAILIALGSIVGTIKEVINNNPKTGVLKLKVYRPFPAEEIKKILKLCSKIAVVEKAISLGATGPLYADLKTISGSAKINNYIVGLGGRDVRQTMIKKIINDIINSKNNNQVKFIGS
jgi:pyruvate ferredoxin oxidoreductase alpha subunit